MSVVEFTSHNIRLDNGVMTRPADTLSIDKGGWFVAAKRVLDSVFRGPKGGYRLADLGCLEGGFSVEFARMGFEVVGIEVRESNYAACSYVKEHTKLPNLQFVRDDAWNVGKYGQFDAVFCSGLLYHIEKPLHFLKTVSAATKTLLILNTNMSFAEPVHSDNFRLSELEENEGLMGRWFVEYATDEDFANQEKFKWGSWNNRRSFWVQREYLLQAIYQSGFNLVMEQFDLLGPNIAKNMEGPYKQDCRGLFVGIKV